MIMFFIICFIVLFIPLLILLPIKNRKKNVIYKKFHDGLLKICEEEKIYVHTYDNINDLNDDVYGVGVKDKESLAAGVYCYKKVYNDEDLKRLPSIHFKKNGTFVLAHEVGHHFSIKYFSDYSEKAADKYIYQLAKKILSKAEIGLIDIEMEVFAETSIPNSYIFLALLHKLFRFRFKTEDTNYI